MRIHHIIGATFDLKFICHRAPRICGSVCGVTLPAQSIARLPVDGKGEGEVLFKDKELADEDCRRHFRG